MENVNPQLRAHESAWRGAYTESQGSKHSRTGAFTKRHQGRLWADGGLENDQRRRMREQALEKKRAAEAAQLDAVRALEEEAQAVARELEEIRHRTRLKRERAHRRQMRHRKFTAARAIANAWRCARARRAADRRRRDVAATALQFAWRFAKERAERAAERRRRAREHSAALSLQCCLRGKIARKERLSRSRALQEARMRYVEQQREASAVRLQALARGRRERRTFALRLGVRSTVKVLCKNVLSQCGVPVSPFNPSTDSAVQQIDDLPCTPTVKCGRNEVVFHDKIKSGDIPKLSLGALPSDAQTYHEEFMSHAPEFSLSWREQLEGEESRFPVGPLGETAASAAAAAAADADAANLEDDDLDIVEDDQVSESGSVVHTVRHLKSKKTQQQQRQRPHSSPTRRSLGADARSGAIATFATRRVGGGFTGAHSARGRDSSSMHVANRDPRLVAAREAAKRRVAAAQHSIMAKSEQDAAARAAAMARLSEMEEKRLIALRKRHASGAQRRAREEKERQEEAARIKAREEEDKRDRERRFKDGMADLRASLRENVRRNKEKAKRRKLKEQQRAREAEAKEKAARAAFLEKEKKRKAWIAKQAKKRALREILISKEEKAAADRAAAEEAARNAARKERDALASRKRLEAARRKEAHQAMLAKKIQEEQKLKSLLRSEELERKQQMAQEEAKRRIRDKQREEARKIEAMKQEERERRDQKRRVVEEAMRRRKFALPSSVSGVSLGASGYGTKKAGKTKSQKTKAADLVPKGRMRKLNSGTRMSKKKKKKKKRSRTLFDTTDEEDGMALLSSRSSPCAVRRTRDAQMRSLGLTKCPSVLERALRYSNGEVEPAHDNWSAPNSPRESSRDHRHRSTAGARAQEWMVSQAQEGALGMLEMTEDRNGSRGEVQRFDDLLAASDPGGDDSDDGSGIVDQMPVRRNGESVDDYVLRCTEALERAALEEFEN